MNCDSNTEKSIGYCYNLALKSPEERNLLQLDLRAAGMARKLKTGEITKRHVEIALYDEPDATRERLRERINHYRGITPEGK